MAVASVLHGTSFLAMPSLSLGPLGTSNRSPGEVPFEGERVPVPCCRWHVHPDFEPALRRFSLRPFRQRVHPSGAVGSLRSSLPGGSALIPPPESPSFFRRSRGPSVGGEPNHALQRTEAGGRLFFVFQLDLASLCR